MQMIPMPEPIEGSATVLIFYGDKKKRCYQTCIMNEDAKEVEKMAEEKAQNLEKA